MSNQTQKQKTQRLLEDKCTWLAVLKEVKENVTLKVLKKYFWDFYGSNTDMFDERDFILTQDDKILYQLMERTVPKQLNELCNTSCASAKPITSGFRGIWSHLKMTIKISCKGRQFNAPATAKQSLIPHVGTTLQMKEFKRQNPKVHMFISMEMICICILFERLLP